MGANDRKFGHLTFVEGLEIPAARFTSHVMTEGSHRVVFDFINVNGISRPIVAGAIRHIGK